MWGESWHQRYFVLANNVLMYYNAQLQMEAKH